MRVPGETTPFPINWAPDWARRLIRDLFDVFKSHARALNGNLSFGDGTDIDNISGQFVQFTSSGTPGAENTIPHTIGAIPCGMIVMIPPASGTVNLGATAWTSSNVFLTCSAATQTVKIFLLAPPPPIV